MQSAVKTTELREDPRPTHVRAVLQVLAVVAATIGTFWLGRLMPGWRQWERATLGGQWLIQILALMVVPLVCVRMLGDRPGRLGITFGDFRRPLETGMTALAVVGPASGMAFPLLGVLAWSPYSWRGGLLLAAVYGICLPLTGLVICKIRPTTADTLPRMNVAVAAVVLAMGVMVSALTEESKPIVSRVLLALLVVGPGEELLFRGVVQSRLDRAFRSPWHFFGAKLGWGWVLASLIFGLAHFFSPVDFGKGGWALWTAIAGLLFGYIRAKGGSFVASGVVHSVTLAVAALFA